MADPQVNILLTAKDMTKGVLSGVGSALAGIGKLALGAAVGGIAAATGAIVGGMKASLDWGNQLDTLQDLLGTTAQESSGLAVMANRIGLSSDELGQSLSIMTRGLLDVEGQAGPSAKAMEGLGISIYDANGQMKDAPTLLQEVADTLGPMEDGFAKSSAMMDIFGRSGVEMGDLLNAAASGGVAAFQAEAEKLGLSFNQEQIDNVIEFGKQTEFMKSAFQGVAAEVGNAVLPAITGFLQNAVMPFIQEHGPALQAWLGANIPKALQVLADFWNNVLKPAVMAVWGWMSTVLMPFLQETVFPWLQDNIPKALQVLSDFWTNVLKPAIETVWSWMSTVLIPFLVDTVFPWLQENIPKALQTLSNFWEKVLQPAIETVWSWMSTTLIPFLQNTVFPWLQEKIPAAIQTLSDFWNETLLPAITAIWEFIDTYIIPIFEDIWELFNVAGTVAIEELSKLWEDTLKPALDAVWKFINDNIIPILEELWGWFNDKIAPVITTIVDGALKNLKNAFIGIRNAIQWAINKLDIFKGKADKTKVPKDYEQESPSAFEQAFLDAGAAVDFLAEKTIRLNLLNSNLAFVPIQNGGVPLGAARGVAAPANQRLTVYGGLHLHGVENAQDLLASLSDLMIG